MKKVLDFINKQATGRKVLFFFAIQLIVQLIFICFYSPRFKVFSNGVETLDLTLFYGVSYVQRLFNSTSPSGLQYYLYTFFPLDLIFPILYSFSYALIAAILLKKLNFMEKKFQWLILLPFIVAFFDYLENFGMISMILYYHGFSENAAIATSAFSSLKWGFLFIGSFIMFILIILFFKQLIKQKTSNFLAVKQ